MPLKNSGKPILACVAGLSGGSDNGYLYSMMKEAMSKGFKCVVVNFRGSCGLKMTSSQLYGSASWRDYKEPVDYLHKKYCKGLDGFAQRRLYGYGVSLGAQIVTLYLVNEGEKSVLSGALILAPLFDIKKNVAFMKTSAYGVYNSLMGLNFNMIVSSKMPEIKPFMRPQRYAEVEKRLKKNKFDLMALDSKMMSYAFGFESEDEYYKYVETKGRLN